MANPDATIVPPTAPPPSPHARRFIGFYFIVLIGALVAFIACNIQNVFRPEARTPGGPPPAHTSNPAPHDTGAVVPPPGTAPPAAVAPPAGVAPRPPEGATNDQWLLLMVMAFGALGSCAHGAAAFSAFAGTGNFKASWTWWYVLQPLGGLVLAMFFYVLFRGSFAAGAGPAPVNVYAILGMAGLAGLFAKAAMRKLQELFDNITLPQPGARPAKPAITAITSADAKPGATTYSLAVNGSGFVKESVARIAGEKGAKTTYDSANKLNVAVSPASAALAAGQKLAVTVANPGNAESDPAFYVVPGGDGPTGGPHEPVAPKATQPVPAAPVPAKDPPPAGDPQ